MVANPRSKRAGVEKASGVERKREGSSLRRPASRTIPAPGTSARSLLLGGSKNVRVVVRRRSLLPRLDALRERGHTVESGDVAAGGSPGCGSEQRTKAANCCGIVPIRGDRGERGASPSRAAWADLRMAPGIKARTVGGRIHRSSAAACPPQRRVATGQAGATYIDLPNARGNPRRRRPGFPWDRAEVSGPMMSPVSSAHI